MKTSLILVAVFGVLLIAGCADQPTTANTAAAANPTDRNYSRSDLQKTGRQTTAGAIQAADPSVTISSGGGGGARP